MAAQDISSTTLMDLMTSDPVPSGDASAKSGPVESRRSFKRINLLQLPTENVNPMKLLSPAKNIVPTKQKKKVKALSYSQLARSLHELAAVADQKNSQKQLLHHVFPKLAVYSSVDPSLAPSLLMLHQQAEDGHVLRYAYYFLGRILAEGDTESTSLGGGIPTPNWDALADLSSAGGVTRADVLPRVIDQLTAEASDPDVSIHPRRVAALKALTCVTMSNTPITGKLYEIVFGILEKVADAGKVRKKKNIFGRQTVDKESALHSNLQYVALSTLRRLPLDQGNPAFLHRAVQGIACADPVGVRHALAMVSEMAVRDPYGVAMAVAKISLDGGVLQDVSHIQDVMSRMYLARLCYILSRARGLDEREDLRSRFTTLLYQLLLDPSERVCFEVITCILGKFDSNESSEERAAGWALLTSAILKFPDPPLISKENSASQGIDENAVSKAAVPKIPKERPTPKPRRPQPLVKLVMRRLESALRSHLRPVLHAAMRIVQEIGKSRSAAYALGLCINEDSIPENFLDSVDVVKGDAEVDGGDAATDVSRAKVVPLPSSLGGPGKESIASLLSNLMEAVRMTVSCECFYVRAAAIKAMIWMQSPEESVEELKVTIAGELSDTLWPASLLNEILLTLHARFKATPEMAIILLDISRLFATKAPGKIDSDVLQLLWKTCLLGSAPSEKHTALEAVTIVLDLPPPSPEALHVSVPKQLSSTSDPKAAVALQRLVQAAVWFLGENANYAAAEYAWESKTSPGTALMMLDGDKMVAVASSRNPTLAGALTRLQRCAFSGSWEVRIVAAQALITIAIRSGEPYRLQTYEFLRALAKGGIHEKLKEAYVSNGEDQGASGTGLSSIISPMLQVLDEMYKAQEQLIKDMRQHDNTKKEWTDNELKRLYENHERLLDLVSIFCYVPRSKYLPLGPTSAGLINIYRNRHHIDASSGFNDPAVITGIADLQIATVGRVDYPPVQTNAALPSLSDGLVDGIWSSNIPGVDRVNDFLGGAGTDAPEVEDDVVASKASVSYDDMWAKTLLEASDGEDADEQLSGTSSPESTASYETSISSHLGSSRFPSLFGSSTNFGQNTRWEEEHRPGTRFGKFSGELSSLAEDKPSYSEPSPADRSMLGTQWESGIESREMLQSPSSEVPSRTSDVQYPEEARAGKALYEFTAGGDDELNLTAGEDLEIEYEVDGWYFVRKKRPGRDGKLSGLVPVLYVTS